MTLLILLPTNLSPFNASSCLPVCCFRLSRPDRDTIRGDVTHRRHDHIAPVRCVVTAGRRHCVVTRCCLLLHTMELTAILTFLPTWLSGYDSQVVNSQPPALRVRSSQDARFFSSFLFWLTCAVLCHACTAGLNDAAAARAPRTATVKRWHQPLGTREALLVKGFHPSDLSLCQLV